jgi:D-alanine-D-alanine ligase
MRRVVVLYNCDYDEELCQQEGVDVSAVRASALAICQALTDFGHETELVGALGPDIMDVIEGVRASAPDLVFNVCESLSGDTRNEVVVPSILDMLNVPYTGAGSLALGMCLHKERTKEVLTARGIANPAYRILRSHDDLVGFDLPFPVFLKLAREDASIGIEETNVCWNATAVRKRAGELLDKYRQPVVAESYIEGREVNVTVLGAGDDIETLPLHEIDFGAMPGDRPNIVSYAAKWDQRHVDYAGTKPVPMKNVSPELEAAIVRTAIDAYRALELRDYGRIDLRVDAGGTPWVIDVNPNCDISPDAGFARSARAAGIAYPDLIGKICEIAWSRYDHAARAAAD